jgi:hypothetical protein
MAPETAPPGKTFKERWPDDAAESSYLAGPWVLLIVGGLLGVLAIPLLLARALLAAPLPYIAIFGLFVVVTIALQRATGKQRSRLARLWKFGAWFFAAAALGMAIDLVAPVICNDACKQALRDNPTGPTPSTLTYLLLVVGTVGVTILVDNWGTSLRRRVLRR